MTPEEKARYDAWMARGQAIEDKIGELERERYDLECEIYDATAEALGRPVDELFFSMDWGCPDSPTNTCAYDMMEDPAMDECLFCGLPDERK